MQIEKDIVERDHRDMTREHSPLKQAEDAVYIDSSDMTIYEVITAISDLIKTKLYHCYKEEKKILNEYVLEGNNIIEDDYINEYHYNRCS